MQFAVAFPLLLFVVVATMQVGGMMLSISRVSSDLVRACRSLDADGLALAADKDAFVKDRIVHASSTLVSENLVVEGAVCTPVEDDRRHPVRDAGLLAQRTQGVAVSFDVSYEIPSLIDFPGLSGQRIARRVECVRLGQQTVEVEVGDA